MHVCTFQITTSIFKSKVKGTPHPLQHEYVLELRSRRLWDFLEWGWEAVTVSVGMLSYRTIRLPSDSLSRWGWDRASEARTPADSESMEASTDLLPDEGALMWAQVSLVSPAWLGPCWCQDVGALRALWPSLGEVFIWETGSLGSPYYSHCTTWGHLDSHMQLFTAAHRSW